MTDSTWKSFTVNAAPYSFNDTSQWENGIVPDGTATFGSTTDFEIVITEQTAFARWTFLTTTGYTFTIADGVEVYFLGFGIDVQAPTSSPSKSIVNNGTLFFHGSSTAGLMAIENNFVIWFQSGSTAG